MSTREVSDRADPIVESLDQLAAPMAAGEKPRAAWRIGTEHEKFVYDLVDHHGNTDDPREVWDRAPLHQIGSMSYDHQRMRVSTEYADKETAARVAAVTGATEEGVASRRSLRRWKRSSSNG